MRDVRARAGIDAALMAAVARDLNLGETEQPVVQAIPQPDGDALERRHFEPLDLVQEAMVERIARLGQRGFDVVEVQHARRSSGSGSPSMVTRARNECPWMREFGMAWRRRRQKVGGLEKEFLIDTHGGGLEHDPEKWKPVFRKVMRQWAGSWRQP